MEIDSQLIAAGGVLGGLIVAVIRLLAADAPMGRSVTRLEEQLDALQDDLDRARQARDDAEQAATLWRARAIDAGWRPDDA